MIITSVHHARLINLGNFENAKTAAWANVEEGETPEEALAKLTAWVEEQGSARRQVATELEAARDQLSVIQGDIEHYESKAALAEQRWHKVKAWLEKVGLELPKGYADDIPF